ncbi:MAG: hypothetical protein LC732_07755, partial [Acidobacteria bacterium]|nr:hypothetical protein [Acidobacteriota bacterium]
VSEGGLATLDLSATPVTLRHGSTNGCTGDYSVVIDGSYAFVGNRCGDGRIEVWDFSEPAAPRYLREQGTSPIAATYHDLVLVGSDYLAGISPDSSGTADLVIVDRRDIENLKYVTRIDIPVFAPRQGRIEGDLLYLADLGGRWAVVDLTDPATPQVLSVTQTAGLARNVAIADTEVVVANGTSTVGFWNTADPTLPLLRGDHQVGWSVWDARYHAGVLHVAADLALGTITGIPSPPALAEALIAVGVDAGIVTISGSEGAALGSSPLTLAASVSSGGAAVGTPFADGGFQLSIAATPGEVITLTATDAEGRSRTIALEAP